MEYERNYKTEIVPYAFPESNGKTCEIGIEKMSITYVQPDDTNHGGRDDVQTITVETEDAICNRNDALNKQSYYLTIKTDRWAVDEPEDILLILKDFNEKLYNNVEQLKLNDSINSAKKALEEDYTENETT